MSESVCACVSQFHVLCREHAQDIADMPVCVARDFDMLINSVGGVDVSIAADEAVPLGYLEHLGKGKAIVRTASVMHAPIDPNSPKHALAHSKPVLCRHLFGRKYPTMLSFKRLD